MTCQLDGRRLEIAFAKEVDCELVHPHDFGLDFIVYELECWCAPNWRITTELQDYEWSVHIFDETHGFGQAELLSYADHKSLRIALMRACISAAHEARS